MKSHQLPYPNRLGHVFVHKW